MKDDTFFVNSPLKRGEYFGSGGGMKCYEDEDIYASLGSFEIRGTNSYQRVNCLTIRYHRVEIVAFGSYYTQMHALATEMNGFWSDKIKRRIEREDALKTREYKALIRKMSSLCYKVIGQAAQQPGMLKRVSEVVAEKAYNKGVEDTKRGLRQFLGVGRYD